MPETLPAQITCLDESSCKHRIRGSLRTNDGVGTSLVVKDCRGRRSFRRPLPLPSENLLRCISSQGEVLEEIIDPGQSGASLERPDMDRVRDLVATGGVSIVLAQDRDRFAREPAYHYLLRKEPELLGMTIVPPLPVRRRGDHEIDAAPR